MKPKKFLLGTDDEVFNYCLDFAKKKSENIEGCCLYDFFKRRACLKGVDVLAISLPPRFEGEDVGNSVPLSLFNAVSFFPDILRKAENAKVRKVVLLSSVFSLQLLLEKASQPVSFVCAEQERMFEFYGQYFPSMQFVTICADVAFGTPIIEIGAISDMIESAVDDKKIVIYGDGKQGRNYLHIDDFAEGLLCILNNGNYPRINLSGDRFVSIREAATEIAKHLEMRTKKSVGIIYSDPQKFSFRGAELSNCDLKSLGWGQKISFINGLRAMIDDRIDGV